MSRKKPIPRFEIHAHSEYSNLRMLDCSNKIKDLYDKAYQIGLAGLVLTDHESLSGHVEVDKIQEEYQEKDKNFKVIRGNEIYLTKTRDKNQPYYHFILIALDSTGHRMLRELSSQSWINSYFDRGMERVPTLYSELEEVIKKYGQGHLHGSSACLGGEINSNVNKMCGARLIGDVLTEKQCYKNIVERINWCVNTFGKDYFTLEVAPGCSDEQVRTNKKMKDIGKAFGIPLVIGTDAHYLGPEDRVVHKALLNSRDGEREVDEFYYYAYLQTEEEIIEHLKGTGLDYEELCANSMKIYDKCQYYSLKHSQIVPQVEVKEYAKKKVDLGDYPVLNSLFVSDEPQERYWVNFCVEELKKKGLYNKEYLTRLEEEADIQDTVGKKLDTCIFAYPTFLQHYIDLFWECGSTVGTGRGSAGAGLNHYLMGLTQLDPVKNNLPYFRFLNKERIELPKQICRYWAV